MSIRRILAATLLALFASILVLGLAGILAFDRGLYLETDSSMEAGIYYSVKRDRALGPDRVLFRSTDPKVAWQVFTTLKQMENPPRLLQFAVPRQPQPPKKEGP